MRKYLPLLYLALGLLLIMYDQTIASVFSGRPGFAELPGGDRIVIVDRGETHNRIATTVLFVGIAIPSIPYILGLIAAFRRRKRSA